jgi:hypothetical protein
MKKSKQVKVKVARATAPVTVNRVDSSFDGQTVIDITGTTTVAPVVITALPSIVVPRTRKARSNVSMITTPDKGQSKPDADWQFDVHQERLQTSSGALSGIHAVVRNDTGVIIGGYKGQKMQPYPVIVEGFDNALTTAKLNFTRSVITTKEGARMFATYTIDVKQGHDAFSRKLLVQSSHNGTLTPGAQFMAEMLRCLNGCIGMSAVFSMFQKHSARFDLARLTGQVTTAIENGTIATERMIERMANIPLNDAQTQNVISNVVTKGSIAGISPKLGYLVHHNWTHPKDGEEQFGNTLYRLYNASTRTLRDIANVGRFEMSRKANIYLTGALNLASERRHDLEALLATPAKPLDFNGVTINLN